MNEQEEIIKEMQKINNLQQLKEFCHKYMLEILGGSIDFLNNNPKIKIRFLDYGGKFGHTNLGRFVFIDDDMYLVTNDVQYEEKHNEDIADYLCDNYLPPQGYVVRAMFAGFYTGFRDDRGRHLYTGDIVEASIMRNPPFPAVSLFDRAKDENGIVPPPHPPKYRYRAGIWKTNGRCALVFDNHDVPITWVTSIQKIGHVFHGLSRGQWEFDIERACVKLGQQRSDEVLENMLNGKIFID